jgi:hypothetical protein
MNKRIIFLTEMGFIGQIPRTHDNMRVEFAQMCALQATHWPMLAMDQINEQYDYAVLLIGKTTAFRDQIYNTDVVQNARRFANKVYFMQEGPSWIFQDMPLQHQFWHYNVLASVDGILTENKSDISYFKGINSAIPVIDIPSLMIEDSVSNLPTIDRSGVIIGGTFCRWYGGFDSYITALTFNQPIYAPSMGRKKPEEDQIDDLTFLPYMSWIDWIKQLNQFKYAIHLMPTFAAGTFAMNCAYLRIPCIGYEQVDTQRNLHPDLSIREGDLESAKKLAKLLKNDSSFYNHCSEQCKINYEKYHSENEFIKHMNKVFN